MTRTKLRCIVYTDSREKLEGVIELVIPLFIINDHSAPLDTDLPQPLLPDSLLSRWYVPCREYREVATPADLVRTSGLTMQRIRKVFFTAAAIKGGTGLEGTLMQNEPIST